MLETKGEETTIVFGYGDVLVDTDLNAEKEVSYMNLHHFPQGTIENVGEEFNDEEIVDKIPLVNIRFDSLTSLSSFSKQVQQLEKNMRMAKLLKIFDK